MKKSTEIITRVGNTVEGKYVDVFAYVEDETNGEVTLGYELGGKGEKAMMCYGRIDPDDPGDVPSRDFKNLEEALGSEYGEVFKEMMNVAERELSE